MGPSRQCARLPVPPFMGACISPERYAGYVGVGVWRRPGERCPKHLSPICAQTSALGHVLQDRVKL